MKNCAISLFYIRTADIQTGLYHPAMDRSCWWHMTVACAHFRWESLRKVKGSGARPLVMLMPWMLQMWGRLPCHIVWCIQCSPSNPGGGLCFPHLFTLICTQLSSSLLPDTVALFTARVRPFQWVTCQDKSTNIVTDCKRHVSPILFTVMMQSIGIIVLFYSRATQFQFDNTVTRFCLLMW